MVDSKVNCNSSTKTWTDQYHGPSDVRLPKLHDFQHTHFWSQHYENKIGLLTKDEVSLLSYNFVIDAQSGV